LPSPRSGVATPRLQQKSRGAEVRLIMDFQDCETAQCRIGGIERIPMLT
jgi:hypothetical protein